MMAVLRRFTPAYVVLVLVFAMMIFAGCGGPGAEEDDEDAATEPEEETEEPEEEEEPEDAPALDITHWENPLDMPALVDRFEVLAWTWTPLEDGEEQESLAIAYRCEGSEVVGGVDARRVSIVFDDDEFVVWLDDAGDVIQAESDGELLPDMAVDLVIRSLLMVVFMPFQVFDTLQIHDVLVGTGPGWEWNIESVGTQAIGDVQAEVTTGVLTMGPPVLDPGDEVSVTFRVGDFGDFQMLVGWEGASTDSQTGPQMQFIMQVTDVVPR